MIKVVIADDIPLLKESLKHVLEDDPDIKVVGMAKNGREAYKICLQEKPDIVLMDLIMPDCDGIEGTRLIKDFNKNTKVVILTLFNSDDNLSRALKNGADGYITKDIGPKELQQTIRSLYMGLGIIQNNLMDNLVRRIDFDHPVYNKELVYEKFKLNEKEIEIIKLIVDGKSYKDMSKVLFASEGTVRNMTSNLLHKLDLKDRIQLAIFAVKNKLV
ncbi:UNVERIFIED_CONTAM: DNA-binding NarL/FixJ family response regulator [Acetivibrio alkalicellulosi]